MKKKNITIDDLTMMVQKGFVGNDKRFDEMDIRFDGIDARLDKVEKRLDKIEELILANHKERIEKLEMQVRELMNLLAVD